MSLWYRLFPPFSLLLLLILHCLCESFWRKMSPPSWLERKAERIGIVNCVNPNPFHSEHFCDSLKPCTSMEKNSQLSSLGAKSEQKLRNKQYAHHSLKLSQELLSLGESS